MLVFVIAGLAAAPCCPCRPGSSSSRVSRGTGTEPNLRSKLGSGSYSLLWCSLPISDLGVFAVAFL